MKTLRVLILLALLFALVPLLKVQLSKPQVHGESWPNGTVKAQHSMRRAANGQLVADGPFRAFHDNGQSETSGQFAAGLRVGEWLWYDREGALAGRCEFERDEGVFHGYFADGQLQAAGPLRGAVRQGLWTEWYENGTKRMQGQFVDGQQHGNWIYWSEQDSSVTTNVLWDHGKVLN